MNKAITDGIQLMPPAFEFGLDVWSSGDGVPGSPTYDADPNATLIAADADFSGCLEIFKTSNTQKLRFTGNTPMITGCYWRVRARVKAISGPLPSVRIAGWAGTSASAHVNGLDETGPSTALTTYGEVVEVSAIVGSGERGGVDMVWGQVPTVGHFGLDLTGANNGVVRIDDIIIEDVTSVFVGSKLDVVDVTDFGAVGDGITDNTAAFEAADAAANGRTLFVPDGVFAINSTVTIASRIKFLGTVTQPDAPLFQLLKNYDYPSYVDAFGDERRAFEKAVQALFNFTDHVALDLRGRQVNLSAPIDVQAAVGNKDEHSARRIIRNGSLSASNSPDWDDEVVTRTANYDSSDPKKLTNVNNVGAVPVGALVEGTGVGREVYVRSVNTNTGEITLSGGLWGAPSSQQYTFTRFKYLLDFSGFKKLSRFVIEDIDFSCGSKCSGMMIADTGLIFHVKDCFFTAPKNRGMTSAGEGCAGILIDRCQFLSSEQPLAVSQRISIGFNVNSNDAKVRNNRALRFKHICVLAGTGSIITGNHFFQDDATGGGIRSAGIVLMSNNPKTLIVGNYIDNCFIDWTNESDATPSITTGFSFGALTITGNIFTAKQAVTWFAWLSIKPFGTGHFLNGVSITGNVFKAISGPSLDRVEVLDDSIAPLIETKARNVTIEGNTFNNVTATMMNPVVLEASESSEQSTWTHDFSDYMPFKQRARHVTSVVPQGRIRNSSNQTIFTLPYAEGSKGADNQSVDLKWSEAVRGKVRMTVRCDDTI